MSINLTEKYENINKFMNNKFLPLLKAYGISEEELQTIIQNLTNNVSKEEYVEALDTEDDRALIEMATNGGIVYKDETGTQFEDINEAFINSTLGAMKLLCKKNGVPMEDYSLGDSRVLLTEAEEKVAKYDRQDRIMFFTGNAEAFYKKHGPKKVDLLKAKKDFLINEKYKDKNIEMNEKNIYILPPENQEVIKEINDPMVYIPEKLKKDKYIIEKVIEKNDPIKALGASEQKIDQATGFVVGSPEYQDYYNPTKPKKY